MTLGMECGSYRVTVDFIGRVVAFRAPDKYMYDGIVMIMVIGGVTADFFGKELICILCKSL